MSAFPFLFSEGHQYKALEIKCNQYNKSKHGLSTLRDSKGQNEEQLSFLIGLLSRPLYKEVGQDHSFVFRQIHLHKK